MGAKQPMCLTPSAEAAFEQTTQRINDQFGDRQSLAYAETFTLALAALATGPDTAGEKPSDGIAQRAMRGRWTLFYRFPRST